jgi:two-component system, OmpR family, response regulator ResD
MTDTLPLSNNKKILVVDDSVAMRTNMKDVLTRAGYHLLEAEDGMKALEILARESDVALVVTDLTCPAWMVWRCYATSVAIASTSGCP